MASVYFVTGKLGSGKSLSAVGRIREALLRGVPVATNLNINLKEMIGRDKKNTRLYRLPDKPTVHDLKALGYGNKSYDVTKDGLIVLDECGTWFNSRTWNDKGRQELIDHLLHIRKYGWDVIFIVQDISIVDKQVRLALAEHTVFCRRMDRLRIPFVSSIVSALTLGQLKIKFPKLHVGIVKYGDNTNSLTVDKWLEWGESLYSCYDTKQMFMNNYPHGLYSVIPPYYTHGRYTVKYTLRNIMRITKIYLRKTNRFFMIGLGGVLSYVFFYFNQPEPQQTQIVQQVEQVPQADLKKLISGYRIISYSALPNSPLQFELDKNGQRLSSHDLRAEGYTFTTDGRCSITIQAGAQSEKVSC